jgi:hypothetical protein
MSYQRRFAREVVFMDVPVSGEMVSRHESFVTSVAAGGVAVAAEEAPNGRLPACPLESPANRPV